MSRQGLQLAKEYSFLMSLCGFNNDQDFLDNFDASNFIHQKIQAVRLAYFEEAKHVYGLD